MARTLEDRRKEERDEIVQALLTAEEVPTVSHLVVSLHRQLDRTTAALEATSQALLDLREIVRLAEEDRDRARRIAHSAEIRRQAEAHEAELQRQSELAALRTQLEEAQRVAEAARTAAQAAKKTAATSDARSLLAKKESAAAQTVAQSTRDLLGARSILRGVPRPPEAQSDEAWGWLRLERSVRADLGRLTRTDLAHADADEVRAAVYRAQRAPLGLERADAIAALRLTLRALRARLETP